MSDTFTVEGERLVDECDASGFGDCQHKGLREVFCECGSNTFRVYHDVYATAVECVKCGQRVVVHLG